jgi:hypothetical protein
VAVAAWRAGAQAPCLSREPGAVYAPLVFHGWHHEHDHAQASSCGASGSFQAERPGRLPPCGSRYGPCSTDSEQITCSTCRFFLIPELFLVGEKPLPGYTLEGDAGLGAWLKRWYGGRIEVVPSQTPGEKAR